jgi:indolepyruvate ferredoxin oxidoreductase
VVPVETEFGRKRAIDQSSCNKDYSCVKGFCPSFVTVYGGKPRKPTPVAGKGAGADPFHGLPAPKLPALDEPYNILVTGIGGTGVITIGALVGMAAHMEGHGCSVLDMTGLSQKGGAVFSHIRIGRTPEDVHGVRIAEGDAQLLLGCDLVVAASDDALGKLNPHSRAVVNSFETITGAFTRNPDLHTPTAGLVRALEDAVTAKGLDRLDATSLATALLGDSIATNPFMLGYAWQKGLIPVSGEAIEKAIVLNGVAVEMNTRAFRWGRLAAHDRAAVERAAAPAVVPVGHNLSRTLDEIVVRRVEFLTGYQNQAYAQRYEALVRRVQQTEAARSKGLSGLAEAVARYYFKLLAYKDEYEVARLYSDPTFLKTLNQQFEGDYRLEFNLAPPAIAERDPATGHLQKRTFGPWMLPAFRVLARLKFLRGTALDMFGHNAERRAERQLITDYETLIDELLAKLNQANHPLAIELASLPEQIRGYGHVKDAHIAKAKKKEAELLACFRNPAPTAQAAE